ncbi:putative sterigmatocystin biosynthesis P450 monooxygenase [Lachnellula suecica]|uniref:Putative sterigmatocystin biosynthesis P450 monooxygenase n=1 Tax=Lachnellula suecica TaxID=602035 RepID=A0A8T9C3N9_9HELO|nr:putative sterigmatocystin biosynthesis P450 monooxygenase [Lachnellula suecica]
METPLTLSPALIVPLLVLLLVYFVKSFFKLVRWRCYMLQLKAQGLPMPPYNVFLGHLAVLQKITSSLPNDAHGHYLPDQIRRAYPELGPNFYLDLAPFAPPMLVLTSLDTLNQVTQLHPLEKYPSMKAFLKPLTGGLDIVTMKGAVWKRWRGIFNPGFSAGHLVTLVPSIVEKTDIFCSILQGIADQQDVVLMKDLTENLTMDIIGGVVLWEQNFDCQRHSCDLVDGIRKQIRWLSFGAEPNLFTRYHPLRPLVHWYYGSKVNSIVTKELEEHLKTRRQNTGAKTRSVIGLAFETYDSETTQDFATKRTQQVNELDPGFKQICMAQIKLFLFSGHDTTSSSICYTLYLLSKHSNVLNLVQQELDTVFTADRSKISQLISKNRHLLNSIPYITAVIKESLRLFPTVSSTRDREQDFFVTDARGRQFPTEGFLVWVNPHAVHHSPKLWDQPDEFVPERWLGERRKYLKKGAWRAFEHGPRNCIGQELAMLESKIVVCMTARDFVVRGEYKSGGKSVNGEVAYQVQLSQPAGDLPSRIECI